MTAHPPLYFLIQRVGDSPNRPLAIIHYLDDAFTLIASHFQGGNRPHIQVIWCGTTLWDSVRDGAMAHDPTDGLAGAAVAKAQAIAKANLTKMTAGPMVASRFAMDILEAADVFATLRKRAMSNMYVTPTRRHADPGAHPHNRPFRPAVRVTEAWRDTRLFWGQFAYGPDREWQSVMTADGTAAEFKTTAEALAAAHIAIRDEIAHGISCL